MQDAVGLENTVKNCLFCGVHFLHAPFSIFFATYGLAGDLSKDKSETLSLSTAFL